MTPQELVDQHEMDVVLWQRIADDASRIVWLGWGPEAAIEVATDMPLLDVVSYPTPLLAVAPQTIDSIKAEGEQQGYWVGR